ncbi:uncharacterized protein TNCV_2734741 [Trichonephila clavipes]|nr:uncharacterized protein TNCV_2734741 [Trichonephila clavipes]
MATGPNSAYATLGPDVHNLVRLTYSGGQSDGGQSDEKTHSVKFPSKLAVANYWFLCKQDAISNKIPLKIKMDRLKFKLEIVEALSTSPPNKKSILTDDEDNSAVIPLSKRLKRYTLPAIHVMTFILAIPG